MSSKKNVPRGSFQVQRERLASLIKALKSAKGEITYEGIKYDLQGKSPVLNYKTFILQATDMSEGEFYKYFHPDIENNSSYSSSGKTFKEPGNVIHTIRPYLTIDGDRRSQKNSLIVKGSLGVKNHKPEKPKLREVQSLGGPVAVFSNKKHEPENIGQYYYQFIVSLQTGLVELFSNSTDTLNEFSKNRFFGKYIKAFYRNEDSEYKIEESTLSVIGPIVGKYIEVLDTAPTEDTIHSICIGLDFSDNSKERLDYLRNFVLGDENLKISDLPIEELLDYRYELVWNAERESLDYKNWSNELKALLLIINIEEFNFFKLIFSLAGYLLNQTKFIIESSSDGISPNNLFNDYSLEKLLICLDKFQIDDLKKVFNNNFVNLISQPIHRHSVEQRSKLESHKNRVKKYIKNLLYAMYLEKIVTDHDNLENNINGLSEVLSHLKNNT